LVLNISKPSALLMDAALLNVNSLSPSNPLCKVGCFIPVILANSLIEIPSSFIIEQTRFLNSFNEMGVSMSFIFASISSR